MNFKPHFIAGFLALATISAPAGAAVVYGGNFTGNDCSGAGFANCYATTAGTTNNADAGGSPTVYKRDSDGSQSFGGFGSVTGNEFTINYTRIGNTLSFTYTAGANDPELHYCTIKQASGYALFYDLSNAITSATINLSAYFPNNPRYSYISFYDTGVTPPPPPVSVPEPAVRRRILWDREGAGLVEAPAHLVVDVRRLDAGAASVAAE